MSASQLKTFQFDVGYVNANPDGVHERRMIGINGEWPPPIIRVKENDRVQITVTNKLGDKNTSLHFHGLFQHGANLMDGPEMVTQCPIAPNQTFTYDFTVDQAGTYWYHSHTGSQYADGLRGMFVIEPEEPLPFDYDHEVVLSVNDHYHLEAPKIMQSFMSRYNPTGAEPIPQNSLFNETKNVTWEVDAGSTYLLRVVNMGLFVSQYLYIEDHTLTVVEVDGVLVEPRETDSLYLAVAQRYAVLVTPKRGAFRFVNVLDQEMLDVLPEDLEVVLTNWMVASSDHKSLPSPLRKPFEKVIESLSPIDDFTIQPLDKTPLFADPDYEIELNFKMEQLGDGVTYAFFNNLTYVAPKVPTLMSVLDADSEIVGQSSIYGSNTNTFVLQRDEIVQIVLNNMDPGKHPFHLHGHNFQVVARSPAGEDDDDPITYDPELNNTFPEVPVIRDTVLVEPNGYIVLRFRADNPGVWFFHCHVDWHLEQGLAITLVEAPHDLQKQKLPRDHIDACKSASVPWKGNAAGRGGSRSEWLNLAGENVQLAPLPEGFTTKGYIALILCTLAAILGVRSIYKYGMEDVNNEDAEEVVGRLYRILEENEE